MYSVTAGHAYTVIRYFLANCGKKNATNKLDYMHIKAREKRN